MIRPATEADVPALFELAAETFEEYAVRFSEPMSPRPDLERVAIRYAHPIRTDPGGAWVAEEDGRLVAGGLAIVREGVWGLSLLVTRPDRQSAGVGSAVLQACHGHAAGARGRIILSSADPRALRAYARLGLRADPSLTGTGTPEVAAPAHVREGRASDIAHTAAVDRHVRGAAHGTDIAALLQRGRTLLVSDGGYAVHDEEEVELLAAYDEAAAADLLRAALARMESATVAWLTARQQWAIRVCVEARLELRTHRGAVFTDGEVGPFTPYLPSGAYL